MYRWRRSAHLGTRRRLLLDGGPSQIKNVDRGLHEEGNRAQNRLRRIHYKSLGNILVLQERSRKRGLRGPVVPMRAAVEVAEESR